MDRYIHPLTISDGKKASFQGPKILLEEEIKKLMFKMFVPCLCFIYFSYFNLYNSSLTYNFKAWDHMGESTVDQVFVANSVRLILKTASNFLSRWQQNWICDSQINKAERDTAGDMIFATYIYLSIAGSLKLNALLSSLCLGTAEKSHKSRQCAAILKHSRKLRDSSSRSSCICRF